MRRWLFGLLAALAFVLLAGLTTLWVREEPRVPAAPVLAPVLPPFPPGMSAQTRRRLQLQFQLQRQLSARSSRPNVDLAKPMHRLPPFKGSQLPDVLDWLCGVDAGSIEPNWRAIEAAGIQPVTLVPGEAAPAGTFGLTLADVLTPMGLSFATDGYSVYVSTPADVERFGHVRHVDRLAFTTRADTVAKETLDPNPSSTIGPKPAIPIEPDWNALRAAGVDLHQLATQVSYGPQFGMLETAVREASATEPLRYQIRDGHVVISTAAAMNSKDHHHTKVVVIYTIGVLVAFAAMTFLLRRRRGMRRFLCVSLVCSAAFMICLPIWLTRPDSISARIGRSRWTIGVGPQRSFVFSKAPAHFEDVFLTGRYRGAGRAVYCDRLGFYAAREGAPYQIFNAHAPRWAVIVLLGALPLTTLPRIVTSHSYKLHDIHV